MKINVITTIEYDGNNNKKLTEEDLGQIYDMFRTIIEDTYNTKDLSLFTFVNTETDEEIENGI